MLICCQKIVNLMASLNIQAEDSMEELLAHSFFNLAQYSQAVRYSESVIAKKKSRGVYEILWESYFQAGNLLKARKVAVDYLSYCKNKHLCDPGLAFIKKLEEKGLGGGQFAVVGVELEIIRGNRAVVLGRFEELERLCGENTPWGNYL